MVAACKPPGEAAHLLDRKIFSLLKVRYNTSRRRPDQSPSETIQSGIATCTGLAMLLVAAGRSVGIPARVVGTPMWSNLRRNHTWVEVWDGDWHFAGAAEPDAAGLDRGWFVGSAAKATDGETTGRTLRTTPFTAMVGERDTLYGRYERNVKFKEQIEKLRGSRTDIYPVTVMIVPGHGHGGLPDRDKIADRYPAVRNPVPRELDWLMTDSVVQDFFWLRVPQPAKRQEILASCHNNRFVFTANENVSGATVFMATRMVDFSKPVDIELNGSTTTHQFTPSLKTFCETLARRGDPSQAFSAAFSVVKAEKSGRLELALPVPLRDRRSARLGRGDPRILMSCQTPTLKCRSI